VKIEEFTAMLDETGIEHAWHHFPARTETYQPPDPPFLCYILPGTADFFADGINYSRAENVELELYTDAWEPDTEKKVADVLTGHGIGYHISRTWLEGERMNMTLFTFDTEIEV